MPALLRAKGLYTFFNELSNIPEGGQLVADNVNIDRDGIIRPRRGFLLYGDTLGNTNKRIKQLLTYKDRIIRHYDCTLEFDDDTGLCCSPNGTFTPFAGCYTEVVDGLRIKYAELNGNLYFTTDEGIKKISALNKSDLTCVVITNAGGVQSLDVTGEVIPSCTGFMPVLSKVAYRVVWGIKDKNENLILGAPSSRLILTNNSGDINIPEKTEICVACSGGSSSEVVSFKPTGESLLAQCGAGEYFTISAIHDHFNYHVWYCVGLCMNTEPSVSCSNGIKITLSNGDTAAQVSTKTVNCINSFDWGTITCHSTRPDFTAEVCACCTGKVVITHIKGRVCTSLADFNTCFACFNICNAGDGLLSRRSYFLINSGANENKYFVWFANCSTGCCVCVEPVTADTIGRSPIKVDLDTYSGSYSSANVANNLASTLDDTCDFSAVVCGTSVIITATTAGDTDDATEACCTLFATKFCFCAAGIGPVIQQGRLIEGCNAKVKLSFVIPDCVTNECYFYQIYRSNLVQQCCFFNICCLSPNDELNLVFEDNITSCELSVCSNPTRIIEVCDITSECFRAGGTLLYTNATSAEGILQSNTKPPLAKDIAEFRDSTFYSNTKLAHRAQLNLLGLGDFISGTSELIIGDGCGVTRYTFVGTTEISTITVPACCTTLTCADFTNLDFLAACMTITRVGSWSTDCFVACDKFTITCATVSCNNGVYTVCSLSGACCITITTKESVVDSSCDTAVNVTRNAINKVIDTEYFIINSAENDRKHFVWLDKSDSNITPETGETSERTENRINFVNANTSCEIADEIKTSLNVLSCFVVTNNEAQITCITTVDDVCGSLDQTYFSITANDGVCDQLYTIWFCTNCVGCAPVICCDTPIKVCLCACDTASQIATKLNTAINTICDFSSTVANTIVTITDDEVGSVIDATDSGSTGFTIIISQQGSCPDEVVISNAQNGASDDIKIGLCSTGCTIFTFVVNNQGSGSTSGAIGCCSRDVILSSIPSAGESVDETARALVNIINRDQGNRVNAFYLSGPDDLPGIILLENKNLIDNKFYLAVNSCKEIDNWNPTLTAEVTATACMTCNNATFVDEAGTLSINDKIYIPSSCAVASVTLAQNIHKIASICCMTFTLKTCLCVPITFCDCCTFDFWKVDVTSDNVEAPNRVYFSKPFQPEAVPLINFIDIGPKDEEIKRILALRDNLFVLKEDAVYILTGPGAGAFSVRLLDSSTIIEATDSATVLNNQIYMLANQGVVTVADVGVGIISRPIEDKIKESTLPTFCVEKTVFGLGYENDRAYILWVPECCNDTIAMQAYRYNTFTTTWTRWTKGATSAVINPADDKLYLGSSDRDSIEKERKNNNRTDYADRDYELTISAACCNANTVTFLSVACIEEGHSIVQTQYVSISKFNRLLNKLDADLGITDTDYFSLHNAGPGDCIISKYNTFIAKLNIDDGCIYSTSCATTQLTFLTDYNSTINLLNGCTSTSTSLYNVLTDAVIFEGLAQSINIVGSKVTFTTNFPYLAGRADGYTNIDSEVVWAPQHLGNADTLKQFSEGTILFDANNFSSGEIAYSSDLKKDFSPVTINGKGPGTFGNFDYSCKTYGGEGNDVPARTFIPRSKQRSRYITTRFKHASAREDFDILGISLKGREISTKGYR